MRDVLLRKAFRDLSQRKLRTILAVVGLAVAVVGVTGFSIATSSVMVSAERSLGLSASPDVILYIRDSSWNQSFVENVSGLIDYEVGYKLSSSTYLKDKYRILNLIGIDTERIIDAVSLAGVFLEKGVIPDPTKNEILFDISAAAAMDLMIGDSILVSIPSQSGTEDISINFTVSGLARNLRSVGYTFTMSLNAWIPLERLQLLLSDPNLFSFVSLQLDENISTEEVKENVLERFRKADIFVEYITIFDDDSTDFRVTIMNLLETLLSIGAVLGLVIGGVLSASTIQIIIASEKTDISIMKVVGGLRRHIFLLYLLESLKLGIIGSLCGLFFSVLGGFILLILLSDPLGLPVILFVVPIESAILGAVIPVLTSVLFSFPIVMSALRVSPMSAFQFSSIKFRTKGHSISRFFVFNISVRNLFRKKIRLTLNVLMLSLAVSGVVGFQIVTDSVISELDTFFNTQITDIEIYFPALENESFVQNHLDAFFQENYQNQLNSLSTLWWHSIDVFIPDLDYSIHLQLLGVHPESPIYDTNPVINGKWLSNVDEGENHIVLTKRFIEHHVENNIGVGDSILLLSPLCNETFIITGIIDDKNNNGLMSYIHLSTMQRILHGEGLVESARIALKNRTMEQEVALALSNDPVVQSRGWSVISMSYWRENNIKQISFFTLIGSFLIILCLIIAIVGGANTFAMAALERTQEIGILKLIGSRFRWILASFLLEAFYIGLMASVVGIGLGIIVVANPLLVIVSQQFFEIPMLFTTQHIFSGIAVGVVTILLASLYPAYRASQTSVISALRYE